MKRRHELSVLQDRGEVLEIAVGDSSVFNLWCAELCADFLSDWGPVFTAGVGHADYWPVGSTIGGDVVCLVRDESLFVYLYAEREIVFISMDPDELMECITTPHHDLEERLFACCIDRSSPLYRHLESAEYKAAVQEFEDQVEREATESARPCSAEAREVARRMGIEDGLLFGYFFDGRWPEPNLGPVPEFKPPNSSEPPFLL